MQKQGRSLQAKIKQQRRRLDGFFEVDGLRSKSAREGRGSLREAMRVSGALLEGGCPPDLRPPECACS